MLTSALKAGEQARDLLVALHTGLWRDIPHFITSSLPKDSVEESVGAFKLARKQYAAETWNSCLTSRCLYTVHVMLAVITAKAIAGCRSWCREFIAGLRTRCRESIAGS